VTAAPTTDRTQAPGGADPDGASLDGAGLEAVSAAFAARLDGVRRLGVAFSGGVDSSLLLALTARVLGPGQVVALLGVSPSLAAEERVAAHAVAQELGVAVVEIQTLEGERPEYQANGPDRCFHCKDELFARIDDEVVVTHHLDAVAYGENADDARRPDRPGSRAAAAHAVLQRRHPARRRGAGRVGRVRLLGRALHALFLFARAAPRLTALTS